MKDKESSLDIYALVNIYREHIRDSFFKKIYDLGNRKFIFQINSPTLKKVPLYIDVRKGFCFMDVEREQEAGQFAMYLRKIFTDRKIRDIYQINFDRVVRIDTYGGDSIVLELFREGNLIVLKDNIIQYALEPREWKNRKIIKGEAYVPPSLTDPLSMNIENIMDIFSASKASIVQTMATRLNLGGELSEEILHRAGINKNTPALQSMGNIDSMIANLKDILQGSIRNRAYEYRDGTIWPIPLTYMGEEPVNVVDGFNEKLQGKMKEEITENPINAKIKKIVENQERILEEYRKNSEECQAIGNVLSSNFHSIKHILETLSRKDTVEGKIESGNRVLEVLEINKAEKYAVIVLDDAKIRIYYDRSPGENMNMYFQKSKEYREKIEGAKSAMENSLKGIVEEQKKKKKIRQKFWFESYHWFFTSSGKIVLAGKNTDTNEKVVKKHMEEKDIYVHADMYGAPSTVIKWDSGEEISEQDIKEAATFSISFSRAWQNGLASGSAYWVTPLQVSKTPESGQYVRKGSWIIRGKRNYLFSLPMKLSIKAIEYNGIRMPMIYPYKGDEGAVSIIPGNRTKDKIALEIAQILEMEPEEIITILPTGNSAIVK